MRKMATFDKFDKMVASPKFDKAREQENQLVSCPLPIGVSGKAMISGFTSRDLKDKQTGKESTILGIKLTVEEPEQFAGKKISGSGLTFFIKDSAKRTKEEAFAAMLDNFENLGLPREVRENYKVFSKDVLGWFTEEPCYVHFDVMEDDYKGNQSGKTVRAYAFQEHMEGPAADEPEGDVPDDDDPNAEYCMYLGKKQMILDKEGDTLKIKSVGTGKERTVEAGEVELVK